MDSKFGVKVQKIGSVGDEKAFSFSIPLSLEPEDEVSAKRGHLYSVISVSSPAQFDPKLVIKIVTDTLQSEYFQNLEGTPLQRLEKSIVALRDKISGLLLSPQGEPSAYDFHAVMAVLWGSVLYVVQYGDGCSYLVREGKIKPINASTEGNFSVASGVIKDKDIVLLGSRLFCEKYPPESLLTSSPNTVGGEGVAAIILKFFIDTAPMRIQASDLEKLSIKISRGGSANTKRNVLGFVAIFVGLLLVASVIYSFRRNQESPVSPAAENKIVQEAKDKIAQAGSMEPSNARELLGTVKKDLEDLTDKTEEIRSLISQINLKLDEINKVFYVDDTPIYDIRVDDKDANPSEMSTASDAAVLIVDSTRSKFYKVTFAATVALSESQSTQAAKPRLLSPTDSGVAFLGAESFFSFDSGNGKIEKLSNKFDFPLNEILAAASYLGNIYAVRADSIYKNGISWTKDEALKDAVSMAIDANIYVLTRGGALLKYTTGTKDGGFSVKGLDKTLSGPTQVYATVSLNNLYVLDRGNSRVVVLDNKGSFLRQFKMRDSRSFDDLRAISVSRDEKFLLVLAGSKIFKVPL